MTAIGIGAWLAAHLHTTPARQADISQALKQAQEQNSAANAENLAESTKAISQPIPMAEPINARVGINNLLCQISKRRKERREKSI